MSVAGLEGPRPRIRYLAGGEAREIECIFIARPPVSSSNRDAVAAPGRNAVFAGGGDAAPELSALDRAE